MTTRCRFFPSQPDRLAHDLYEQFTRAITASRHTGGLVTLTFPHPQPRTLATTRAQKAVKAEETK